MATIRDIAKATRHSTATVDRVLNNRPGVRDATRQAILKAAADLNYGRAPALDLAFDIVLPNAGGFMRDLASHMTALATDRPVRVHFVNYDAPEEIVHRLDALGLKSAGIALVALDHILIREALKSLIQRNTPVVTLLTDISSLPHQGYIGIDNRLAGRLAGHLIGRFLPRTRSQIALFTGSNAYRGHEEREMGFRGMIRENFPHLHILEALEIAESDDAGYDTTRRLLETEPPLAAIYNIGAGSDGIARAISGRDPATKPVFIAHDLSPDTRRHLLSGAIDALIDQNAALTAQRALARLQAAAGHHMLGVCDVMDSRIIFRDNIPRI